MDKSESKESEEFWMQLVTKYPHLTKQATKLNYQEFSKLDSDYLAKNKSRERFIYDVAERIQQAGFFYIKTKKLLEEEGGGKDDTTRLFYESLEKETKLWLRSLQELFVMSFLFRKTNKNDYFRYFFMLQALDAFAKRENTDSEFFGLTNPEKNLKPIDKIVNEMDLLEKSKGFELKKCWFVDEKMRNKGIKNLKQRDYRSLPSSYRYRFIQALPKLEPPQRLILGFDYSFFSNLSTSIHSSVGGPKNSYDLETYSEVLDAHLQLIPLTAAHVMLNLHKILKRTVDSQVGDLENVLIKGFDHRIYRHKKKKFKVDDYVLVDRIILARLTEVKNTKYGYQTVRIENIDESGWKLDRDIFTSDRVEWLADFSKLKKAFRDTLKKHGINKRVLRKDLLKSMDKSMNHTWHKAGAREHFFGDYKGAVKKIKKLIDQRDN